MTIAEQLEKKGIEQGIEKGKIENARAMLAKGYSLTDIVEITALTEAQLKDAGLIGHMPS